MSTTTLEHIEGLLDSLPREEQLRLIEAIVRRLRADGRQQPSPSHSLYGIWKDQIPPDFDLDAVLAEIRTEWIAELDEIAP